MAEPDPHQDETRNGATPDTNLDPVVRAPDKREPIVKQTPLGVALLIGVLLLVHLILLLAGPQATQAAQFNFGTVPSTLYSDIEQHQFLAVLTPLIAHQFLHGGTLHIVMNLAMLLQCGPVAELGLNRHGNGALRFVLYFIACGICGALLYSVINPHSNMPTIGASGAISGVFAGFLWAAIGLAKPGQAMLRPVLTSAGVFLLINVGLAWVGRALNVLPIAWESHLGGFLAGLALYPAFANVGRRTRI
jgi:membrane associated rhomboid family serine protease